MILGSWGLDSFVPLILESLKGLACEPFFFKENKMKKRSVFKHSGGHYFVDEEMFFNPPIETLNLEQKNFVEAVKKKHGHPSLGIWLKRSIMSGQYPPMYSQLFPFWGKDILEAKSIESIELGYEIAQAHKPLQTLVIDQRFPW